jgi:uncharacterized protein
MSKFEEYMSELKPKSGPDFFEYEAVLRKVSVFSQKVTAKYADELNCQRGCAQCCVAGLQVLPVEAAYVQQGLLGENEISVQPADSPYCAFLDGSGACQIYEYRPLVCRTHGLPLKIESTGPLSGSISLRILNDDVVTCQLNFVTDTDPAPQDVLNEIQVQRLLHVVNARFCEKNQIKAPLERVALIPGALGKDS